MAESKKSGQEGLEEAKQEIERLNAQNAALRGQGKVNREAKNSVFLDLFGRKEYLIRMYRDLHPEDTETMEDDLTVVTVENVLTIKPYNDLGALFSRRTGNLLIMAESQAKWSINVLIRLWEYVIDAIMNYIINNDFSVYNTSKLEIPDVEAYIIYIGKSVPRIFLSGRLPTDEQGHYILSLNEEFFGGEKGKPELTAKVVYIKNGTGVLEEYIRFEQIYDEQMAKHREDTVKAIQEVFRICGEENILTEYLTAHRSEVEKIMMTMVSPEHLKRAEEKERAIKNTIVDLREFGHSEAEIKERLIKKYKLTPGYAQNCLDTEWAEDEWDE